MGLAAGAMYMVALAYPDQLDIIGVAEPVAIRNERSLKKHNIANANRFNTWEGVFNKPKLLMQ